MGKKYKDLKKDGKVTLDAPKSKERKHFAPPTKTHPAKKGKGSYDRKKDHDEDNEEKACWKGYKKVGTKKKGGRTVNDCVKVNESVTKFVEAVMANEHSTAHRYLKQIINKKLQNRIKKEIETPLFGK
jgi:hypothetical protein